MDSEDQITCTSAGTCEPTVVASLHCDVMGPVGGTASEGRAISSTVLDLTKGAVGETAVVPVATITLDSQVLRSPLREGTALDGLVPNRPLLNSLLARSDLRPVEPPIDPSTDFTRCRGFLRTLEKAKEAVAECDTLELAPVAREGIAPLHQPKVKEISDRKLAYHIPGDPIDPVVVFVKAIPLVHRVLHQDASGKPGLDLDGVAYIVERLGEAERLRTHEQDIRFDVLLTLSAFLGAIIDKVEEECWACVEAA